MKFAVRQLYYDDGTVKAWVWAILGNFEIEPYYSRKLGCDEYLDLFDTEKQAETFKEDALVA